MEFQSGVNLYFPKRFFKDLSDDHTYISLYMGIKSNKLYSIEQTQFKVDFMFNQIIYNKKHGFECNDENICHEIDSGNNFFY